MPQTILNIDYFLKELDKSLYTIPLMIVLNILFLVIAFQTKPVEKIHRILVIYGILALAQDVFSLLITLMDNVLIKNVKVFGLLCDYSVLCFIGIEFILFYTFFYNQFSNKKIQKLISATGKIAVSATAIITLYATLFTFPLTIRSLSGYVSVLNSILILIPAFYYFYTLFLEPPVRSLLKEPAFWITTGIAFLQSLNLPLFFMEHYLFKHLHTTWYAMYSIYYIAYSFLFIIFIISVLCNRGYKKPRTLSKRLVLNEAL